MTALSNERASRVQRSVTQVACHHRNVLRYLRQRYHRACAANMRA